MQSLSWFRFQLWPKNPYSHVCLNYTGCLKIKYMVQQKNIRKSHDDDHYCAALYRYLHEFSLLFRDYCTMISNDDKNKIKVGEPGCPVAAVTRGNRVLVGQGQVVQVADQDFSNATVIPTVFLVHDLPPTIDLSWYRGFPTVDLDQMQIFLLLQSFLSHCCRERKYLFSVKKCGDEKCATYLLPRLPPDVFARLEKKAISVAISPIHPETIYHHS